MASSLCERKTENKAAAAAGSHTLGGWIYGFHSCLLTFLQNLVKLQRTREFSTFAHTTFMLYTINLATSQDLLYIIEVDLLPNLVLYLVGLFTSLQSNHESLRNRS